MVEVVVIVFTAIVGSSSIFLIIKALRKHRRTRKLAAELQHIDALQEELRLQHQEISTLLTVNEQIRQRLEKLPHDKATEKDKLNNKRERLEIEVLLKDLEEQQRRLDLHRAGLTKA